MPASNILNPASLLTVGQMMNKNFHVLYPDDTLRTVMEYYLKYKVYTLPVVDRKENLIGVFPKKRLYKLYWTVRDWMMPAGPIWLKIRFMYLPT